MRINFRYSLIIFLLISSVTSNAQVKFYTTISPGTIHKDELATFRIVIENSSNLQHISPPSFKDFIIISGPNEESGSVPGTTTNYLSLSFILQPRHPGTIKIGSTQITENGKKLKSNSLKLSVKNSTSGAANSFSSLFPSSPVYERSAFDPADYILKRGEDVNKKVKQSMQLKLHLNKKTCYVGEPVVASYKLYSRLKSDSRLMTNPSFNGFSVIDIQAPDVTAFANEKLEGREYNCYTIRKAQLYPLQPGTVQVESAELENKVQFINAESPVAERSDLIENFDAFGGGPYIRSGDVTNATVNLMSEPQTIVVKPLPEINRPASFKGAVGNFTLSCKIGSHKLAQNEAGLLSVTINGSGNLQLITAPDINWPQHFEAFDPKTEDQLTMTAVPVTGRRTFQYAFSADSTGNFIIPAVSFSYFDPQLQEYKILQSEPVTLSISPAKIINRGTTAVSKNVKKVSWLNSLLENRNLMVLIVGIFIVAGVGLYAIRTRKKTVTESVTENELSEGPVQTPARVKFSNQQNPLETSEKCILDPECSRFYGLLYSDLKNFLADKMERTPQEVTRKSVDSFFEQQNIPNEYSVQLQQLIQEIELQLYSPVNSHEEMQSMYRKAQTIVQSLNLYCISSQ